MKAFKVLDKPEAFQLMADKTRRKIIFLLRAKEMTVSQLAAELRKTPQAIYHHIRKFKEADMVEVAREERVDHFIETYYQATAEVFEFRHGEGTSRELTRQHVQEALQHLPKLGFEVRMDEELIDRLVDLKLECEECGMYAEYREKAEEVEELDFWSKGMAANFANLLAMSDEEYEATVDQDREFRDVLLSTLAKKAKAKVQA